MNNLPSCSLLWSEDHCGTDESGKGDYFGPLVIAGVYLPMSAVNTVKRWGVRDSKLLTDRKTVSLARIIENHLITRRCILSPPDYNIQYKKFNNLNKMLAYGHAKVVEKLFKDTGCKRILIDKFDLTHQTSDYLSTPHQLEIREIPKGERDLAVACASVIARASFLKSIGILQERHGYPFAKGASAEVKRQAAELTTLFGADKMTTFAKLHFRMR